MLVSCGKQEVKPLSDETGNSDGSTYTLKSWQAVIPAPENLQWAFGRNYKNWQPSGTDIEIAEELLAECFNKQSDYGNENPFISKTLEDYNRQFIGAEIEGGDKVILVNCFCKSEEKNLKDWKNSMVLVADGGNCYFHVKVNLDTKSWYGLLVNGFA